MYEDCPSYKLYYTYDANGLLSGIKKVLSSGTIENYAVLCNMFGDVIGIYNSSKALVAKYTYDTWGKLLSITNASGTDISSTDGIWTQNSIRYRGYVYDNETKLYYLQSRYYDPETCRFINADSYIYTGQGLSGYNMYTYCNNNANTYIDTSGDSPILIIGIMAVAIIGGAIFGGLSKKNLAKTANTNVKKEEKENQKNISSINNINSNTQKNEAKNNTKNVITNSSSVQQEQAQELTIKETVSNILIGATLGVAVGGAIVAVVSGIASVVVGSAFVTIPLLGLTGAKAFAWGVLAFDYVAMIAMPFFGIALEPIEYS